MNKKAFSKISIIFWSITFIILWAVFIAGQLATWGHAAVINGSLTGIEAFFFENLNLLVAVIFLIFILAIGLYGGD
jgi:di/tricarboxylate transporter